MMGSLFFFIRCLVITVVFVVLLQIRLGESTLEERADSWIHQSSLIGVVNDSAQGGIRLVRDGWRQLTAGWSGKFWKQKAPGSRDIGAQFKRSEKYVEEQAEKLKNLSAPASED